MQKFCLLFAVALVYFVVANQMLIAQHSGNINYQSQTQYLDSNINLSFPSTDNMVVGIKGIANVKADSYVAIFSLTQTGKTAEEANQLMQQRIDQALSPIKNKAGISTYIDMVSFVPMYAYEVEKKMFSKKNYNEIPIGFELKKNIHIEYKDPNLLNELISLLAGAEIYDLVRVDYFSSNIEATKKELMQKAKTLLQDKLKNYQTLLNTNLDTVERQLIDGYKMVLPTEMYRTYEAYNSTSLDFKRNDNVQVANKSTTQYYQPIMDKEFDFVINPNILEPVIQVIYELKLRMLSKPVPTAPKTTKNYILITPNGELRDLHLGQ